MIASKVVNVSMAMAAGGAGSMALSDALNVPLRIWIVCSVIMAVVIAAAAVGRLAHDEEKAGVTPAEKARLRRKAMSLLLVQWVMGMAAAILMGFDLAYMLIAGAAIGWGGRRVLEAAVNAIGIGKKGD